MKRIRCLLTAVAGLCLATSALAADPCAAPAAVWGHFPVLSATDRAIDSAHRLTIVALGSSSTQGTGASAPDRTYPAQLAAILAARLPGTRLEVLNRGIGGETVAANLKRLDADVLAAKPDLVIWQVGTNDALQGLAPAAMAAGLADGIARIRAIGSDVVLMETQYFPGKPDEPRVQAMMAAVREVARATRTPVLPRGALMRYWLDAGQLTAPQLVGADGLHMTDASYHCLAMRVADLFPAAELPAVQLAAAKGPAPAPVAAQPQLAVAKPQAQLVAARPQLAVGSAPAR